MPTYRYEAAHEDARIESGEIEAESVRAARAVLRSRGLVALSVEATGPAGSESGRVSTRRLSTTELALATRQLASLLTAGLPLDMALATLIEQSDSDAQREVFRGVRSDVTSGHRFADGLARYPKTFPPVYCATVAAGEQVGNFGAVLERLAQYLEDRQALRGKLLAAATYPAIVVTVALAIVLFLTAYVVPQVVAVFEHTQQALPWPTRVLLALSSFVSAFGIWLLVALGAGTWLLRIVLRRAGPRAIWDRTILRLPFFGRLVRGVDTARFASTLAMLVEAGVQMLRALAAAEATLSNSMLRSVVADAIDRVREGTGLARALAPSKVFPPVLVRLVEVGEATGQLPRMLSHAARNQTNEVERRATALATLLEPVLIMVMGAVVMGIVLAVLMPIIEINQLVR